ncbi:uncharacterized protein LOC136021480 [Lathamus discolor]|uniref:uncharacterized protein LOC136021480 n=1 Tax=Lathamus discolor TaxID=678569 RepID=UPI0032B85CB9
MAGGSNSIPPDLTRVKITPHPAAPAPARARLSTAGGPAAPQPARGSAAGPTAAPAGPSRPPSDPTGPAAPRGAPAALGPARPASLRRQTPAPSLLPPAPRSPPGSRTSRRALLQRRFPPRRVRQGARAPAGVGRGGAAGPALPHLPYPQLMALPGAAPASPGPRHQRRAGRRQGEEKRRGCPAPPIRAPRWAGPAGAAAAPDGGEGGRLEVCGGRGLAGQGQLREGGIARCRRRPPLPEFQAAAIRGNAPQNAEPPGETVTVRSGAVLVTRTAPSLENGRG